MADNNKVAVKKAKKKHTIQYDRWGYFFIAPFFLIYVVFSLIPLVTTFVYSFFEYYRIGLEEIGPSFRVYKYFTGSYNDYSWEFDDAAYALDDLIVKYDENGNTLTVDIKDEIKEAIVGIDGSMDVDAYYKDISKMVDKEIKRGSTPQTVLEKAKKQITCKVSAFSRNISIVFSNSDNMGRYFLNTIIMWVLGFIPQILVSLLLAVWFTNTELKLKCQQFFKTVIYMPNLIMAAAFAMLFVALFSPNGPVNSIIKNIYNNMNASQIAAGTLSEMEPVRFFTSTGWTRGLVATMNFLMWYGNTTLLLMSGIMGIDNSIFEAARIDGANPLKIFFKITIPLLLPIFVYVLITSLIGGIQMFDVPQILTNGFGTPNRTTMTIIMKLNKHLASKNYGPAGVTSIIIFAITGVLSALVHRMTMKNYQNKR